MDRKKSIEILNKAVAEELLSVHQYMYYHFHCDDRGYEPLSAIFKRVSIVEMMHVEMLAERILFLKGDVEMKLAGDVVKVKGKNDIERIENMLKTSRKAEEDAILLYNKFAKIAGDSLDSGTKTLFEKLIPVEEDHYDIFDTEMENFESFGENYISLQAIQRSQKSGSGEQGA